ncbi:MAG: molecular chaperone TorD family protein [Methylobacteriaceae bacterium]|nr:molecular chaperone TorD family protein [Methylobacteriaceae bacterium]
MSELDRLAEADLWSWLVGVFAAPPGAGAIEAWRAGPARERLDDLAEDAELQPFVARMRAAMPDAESAAAVAARLNHLYGRLFLGVGGPSTIPPYESAHVGEGRLFQAPTAEMERLVAAHDLHVDPAFREPADHLAIELALMARLVGADHPDRAALAARLAGWTPRFCRLCAGGDADGFFAGAAGLLAVLVARESRRVAVSVEQTQFNRGEGHDDRQRA